VAYLTVVGYSATFAATAMSLFLILTTAGTLLDGPLADRFGARSAAVVTFIFSSLGMFALLEASYPFALVTNIVAGVLAAGALWVQMPLVTIESLGVKHLGRYWESQASSSPSVQQSVRSSRAEYST